MDAAEKPGHCGRTQHPFLGTVTGYWRANSNRLNNIRRAAA